MDIGIVSHKEVEERFEKAMKLTLKQRIQFWLSDFGILKFFGTKFD